MLEILTFVSHFEKLMQPFDVKSILSFQNVTEYAERGEEALLHYAFSAEK